MLHILVGGLAGAVFGAVIAAAVSKASGKPITWGTMAGGAAAGLVAGALASATLGVAGTVGVSGARGLAAFAAGGAGGSATDQVAHNALEGRPLGDGVTKATAIGAALGGATFGAGRALAPVGRKVVAAFRRPPTASGSALPKALSASSGQPRGPPAPVAAEPTHQTYFGYLWSKREMLTNLDASHFHAMRLRLAIMSSTTNRRVVSVPVKRLVAAHVIDHPGAVAKMQARAASLRLHSSEVLASGRVGLELQNSVIPSKNMIRVVRFGEGGQLFVFDGNGRMEAIRQAFRRSKNLAVEVEVFETSSRGVSSIIGRLMGARGLTAGQ